MSSFISRFVFFFLPNTKWALHLCYPNRPADLCHSQRNWLLGEKLCLLYVPDLPVPKAALSPVIALAVNRSRAGRVCDCRASALLLCPQPSPAPLLGREVPAWLGCCRGRYQKDPDYKPAWQAPHCVTLYSEVRGIKTLTCQCWKHNTNPSHFLGILNEECNCWENMKNNICFSTHFVSMLPCSAPV